MPAVSAVVVYLHLLSRSAFPTFSPEHTAIQLQPASNCKMFPSRLPCIRRLDFHIQAQIETDVVFLTLFSFLFFGCAKWLVASWFPNLGLNTGSSPGSGIAGS